MRAEMNRKHFLQFLQSFGKEALDLKGEVRGSITEASVALPNYYIRNRIVATVHQAGSFVVSDMPRLIVFVKSMKSDKVLISQVEGQPFRAHCGSSSATFANTEYIRSALSLERAEAVVREAQQDSFKTWSGRTLGAYAAIDSEDLIPVRNMSKVAGKLGSIKVSLVPADNELVFSAGCDHSVTMSHVIETNDGSGDGQATSLYGPWLITLLGALPEGRVSIFTGEDSPLILHHDEVGMLMVVPEQEGRR